MLTRVLSSRILFRLDKDVLPTRSCLFCIFSSSQLWQEMREGEGRSQLQFVTWRWTWLELSWVLHPQLCVVHCPLGYWLVPEVFLRELVDCQPVNYINFINLFMGEASPERKINKSRLNFIPEARSVSHKSQGFQTGLPKHFTSNSNKVISSSLCFVRIFPGQDYTRNEDRMVTAILTRGKRCWEVAEETQSQLMWLSVTLKV